MKQLVWSPSSINFGSRKKGESVTAESTLSITEGSALLTPGKISPLPGADYPVQIKNTEGNLHIHPAFSFAAARYYLTSAGVLTTNRDIAELYLGNANAGEGLPLLPVPITLVITTPPGEIDPADPLTINYTSSAVLWVKVFFKVNDSEWFFYDIFNATGTFDMDISEWGFSHGDILTIKVQDDESTSFYDTVAFDVMVKNIVIDSIGTIYLIGEFEDGVDYYATPEGEITTDITGIYLGVGNADGDIDLDIKELKITDVAVPETVQLGVAFDVSGNYVMIEDKIVIEGYNGSSWVKLHVGDYIEVADGSFTESVTLQSADGFTVNSSVTVRVRSYGGYALNGSGNTNLNSTITANPIILTAGVPGTVSGTSDGIAVQVFYKLQSAGDWAFWCNAYTNELGVWETEEWTLETAGTYDFRISDFHIPGWYIDVPDVIVASGVSTENLFVTCILSAPQNQFLLKRLKSDLSHVSKLSTLGTGDNQFSSPLGVAVDDTYIYIADSANDRILKWLKSDLSYVSKIGSRGTGDDQFYSPYGITVDDTYIYITDTNNHRIQKRLKSDLSYVSKIGSSGTGNDQFSYPYGIAVDDTYIYTTDAYNNRIQKRLKSDLSYVSKIGSQGTGNDQFSSPLGVAVDDTYIYIVDTYNHRIQKRLKSDLSYVSKIGSQGTGDDQFRTPRGIAVDDTYIYIADTYNNRIQKRLKSDLSYISKIGSSVDGDDDMTRAWAIAVEPNDWD